MNELPLLQATNPYDGSEQFNPVNEEYEDGSFDLVAPYEGDGTPLHSLERQADIMFSSEHMLTILTNPRYLARFRDFLVVERPKSIPVLTYYLNAKKALKALQYTNSLVRLSVDVPTAGIRNSKQPVGDTINAALEARVQDALEALTAEELPAFITYTCISITSKVVEERVRGTLPEKFQGTSDALAEVFCLTDPSRPDNPIIFASGGNCIEVAHIPSIGANLMSRIPSNNTIRRGLCTRPKLSILARPQDQPKQCPTYPRRNSGWTPPLRAFPQLPSRRLSFHEPSSVCSSSR